MAIPQYFTSPPIVSGKRYTHNFPDPFVLRVGRTYYAYATSTGGKNLPVLVSNDLESWFPSSTSDAMPTPPSWALADALRGAQWAPAVVAIGGRYVAYSSWESAPGRRCISAAWGPGPLGPFTDRGTPLQCDWDPAGSIDPEPFIDSNGVPYLLWKSEGERNVEPTRLWSRRLSGDGLSFTSEFPSVLLTTAFDWEQPLIENPSMIRFGGGYHLLYSANNWESPNYAMGLARCAGPRGPCERTRGLPLIPNDATQWGPGGGSLFVDALGQLRIAYHAWNPPYSSYPRDPNCDGFLLCASQGYRAMRVARLEVSGSTLALAPSTPFGNVDLTRATGPRQVQVAGWTIDPDTTSPIFLHIYVNGTYHSQFLANATRPDVGRAFPTYGANHGFTTTITNLQPGPNRICVFGINTAAGTTNTLLGCRNVTTPSGDPFGSIDVARVSGPRQAQVAGWTIDPDTADPIATHIYVNGTFQSQLLASTPRPDVGRAFPTYGANHGFTTTITNLQPGPNRICVFGINTAAGTTNTLLGCRNVTI